VSTNPFDIIGAKSAGLRTAWVKRDPNVVFDPWGVEPDLVVSGLDQLAPLFGSRRQLEVEAPLLPSNTLANAHRLLLPAKQTAQAPSLERPEVSDLRAGNPVWIWFVTRSPSRIDLDERPSPLNGESLAM
jgi:hypothetical protein